MLGHGTTESEGVIRAAIGEEQLQTEMYKTCSLKILEKEMKYNNGNEYKTVNIFYCSPTEQISVSLGKELIANGIITLRVNGYPNIIVNLGMYKWEEGFMHSALLCTKTINNSSPRRRGLIVSAEKPVIESYYNAQKSLEPIYDELVLL